MIQRYCGLSTHSADKSASAPKPAASARVYLSRTAINTRYTSYKTPHIAVITTLFLKLFSCVCPGEHFNICLQLSFNDLIHFFCSQIYTIQDRFQLR